MNGRPFQWSLWGWPIVMGILSTVGLLSALLGDHVWDWVSWFTLGVPVAACLWYGLRRKRTAQPPN